MCVCVCVCVCVRLVCPLFGAHYSTSTFVCSSCCVTSLQRLQLLYTISSLYYNKAYSELRCEYTSNIYSTGITTDPTTSVWPKMSLNPRNPQCRLSSDFVYISRVRFSETRAIQICITENSSQLTQYHNRQQFCKVIKKVSFEWFKIFKDATFNFEYQPA